jgi:hypothetical protein
VPGISESTRGQLLALIERFLREADPKIRSGEIVIAESEQVLPVTFDLGGFCAVTLDGSVRVCGWEEEDERLSRDPQFVRAILYRAATKYPELSELMPVRPPEAKDCPHCPGVERARRESGVSNLLCSCGGLGWVI